jgi:hypothetical protein
VNIFKNLWIIGNGFDRSCGLETSYVQFLEWYKQASNELWAEAYKLKENKKHSQFIKNIHPLAEVFNESMQVNRDTLFSLDYYINHYDESVIKKFKELIHEKKEIITWTDLELKLGEISKNFFFDDSDVFGMCMDDLHLALNKYLFEVDQKAEKDGTRLFNSIDENRFTVLRDIDIDSTVFIVLNYTKNFERFLRNQNPNKPPNIVYLHGTVEDGNTVLGLGSETQIFNFAFAKNPMVIQRILKTDITKGIHNVPYEDFRNFLQSNFYTRDKINIFGCSIGASDAYLWFTILVRFWQDDTVKINIYDAYGKLYNRDNQKYAYHYPKEAKKNEIICNLLYFYRSSDDSEEITARIFTELASVTEEYIDELEQSHVPESDRLLIKHQEVKISGDMGSYMDLIDKYLASLETEFGKIDAYDNKLNSIIKQLNDYITKIEESDLEKKRRTSYEDINNYISDDDVNEFRREIEIFIKTGELRIPIYDMEPGIYKIDEEPYRTIFYRLSLSGDNNIKFLIAQSRGIVVDGSVLSDHTYSFQSLAKYANEKCECDINKAIEKISGRDKDGIFEFCEESERNYIIQETTKQAIDKIKKVFEYHHTYDYD